MAFPYSRRASSSSSSYMSAASSATMLSASSYTLAAPRMMKIVIAGTNGFAQYLAVSIETETPHQFLLLSHRSHRELQRARGWQIVVTNYNDPGDLDYILRGVDVVISTIAGPEQIALINAAATAGVARFVPSEFGPLPSQRRPDDPTDNDRSAALRRLRYLETRTNLRYTVFSCGLFYERFQPGGLSASSINVNGSLGGEGELLVDMRNGQGNAPTMNGIMQHVNICLTSARDAARFVVAALSLPHWGPLYTFHGDRLNLDQFFHICQSVSGYMGTGLQWQQISTNNLLLLINQARLAGNHAQVRQYSQLLAIGENRCDIRHSNLNALVNVRPEGFGRWLNRVWR